MRPTTTPARTTADLVINFNGQTVTVNGHFTGTNAQTGVERINFTDGTFAGYLLGADDYLVSRLDPNNRDSGGVNLSASTANNFIVGEQRRQRRASPAAAATT